MSEDEVAQAIALAVAAVGRPCRYSVTLPHLRKAREDGWWCLGAVWLTDGRRAWQEYWHPETGRGWLWGIRHVAGGGVQPRRFVPEWGIEMNRSSV